MDPRFKLAHVTDKDDILKEIEKYMIIEMDTEPLISTITSEVISPQSSTSGTHPESVNSALVLPPSKKARGLSKILAKCFGNAEVQLTPQQKVKQEIIIPSSA